MQFISLFNEIALRSVESHESNPGRRISEKVVNELCDCPTEEQSQCYFGPCCFFVVIKILEYLCDI
jgi:hypothetical protein